MPDHTLPLFSLQEETKEIPLTRGKVAIVDAADYDWLMQFKWYAVNSGAHWYASRELPRNNGRMGSIKMHRFILGISNPRLFVDHIDMNGLNNTRPNLRPASRQQNMQNRQAPRHNASGYKGVVFKPEQGNWEANIYVDKKQVYLGKFATAVEAAIAYDEAATKFFGEFARLNFHMAGEPA